jgi:Tol biopolymer transport system component
MSPEQAQGKALDRRTDLWSLGVVLYEMATGRLPFEGESDAAVTHSIVHGEPEPVTALRAGVPVEMDRVIGKALAKDPAERFQQAEDLLVDLRALRGRLLKEPKSGGRPATAVRRRRWVSAAAGAVLFAAGVGAGLYVGATRRAVSDGPLRKFRIELGADARELSYFNESASPALSPDGSRIAYIKDGKLWIWDLQRAAGREIPGTEPAADPFWSPDSASVAFRNGWVLRKANVQTGSITAIAQIPFDVATYLGAAWSPSGTILVGVQAQGLFEVPARGGEFTLVQAPDRAKGEYDFHSPHYLPDGRAYLYTLHPAANFRMTLCVRSGEETRCGLEGTGGVATGAIYDPRGYILWDRIRGGRSLLAAPFSTKSLAVTGDAFVVADGAGGPTVAQDGTLQYYAGTPMRAHELVMIDRTGSIRQVVSDQFDLIRSPAISPDGTRVALSGTRDGNSDIWVCDLARKTGLRLTTADEMDQYPAWSPDGSFLAYVSGTNGAGRLVKRRSDGSGEIAVLSPQEQNARTPAWSSDGRQIAYTVLARDNKIELWTAAAAGGVEPRALPGVRGGVPAISPDGRWLAYESRESGRNEVYVVSFPSGEGKWLVSSRGGQCPRWKPTGGELFYLEGDVLMAAPVETKPVFRPGAPKELFDGRRAGLLLRSLGPTYPMYDVTPDGRHIVAMRSVPAAGTDAAVIVQNWPKEFGK